MTSLASRIWLVLLLTLQGGVALGGRALHEIPGLGHDHSQTDHDGSPFDLQSSDDGCVLCHAADHVLLVAPPAEAQSDEPIQSLRPAPLPLPPASTSQAPARLRAPPNA